MKEDIAVHLREVAEDITKGLSNGDLLKAAEEIEHLRKVVDKWREVAREAIAGAAINELMDLAFPVRETALPIHPEARKLVLGEG
jgi:hypothetical protein